MTDELEAEMVGERVRNLDVVAEKLDDPQTAASVLSLLDNADVVSGAVQILAGFFKNGEHMLDNIAGATREFLTSIEGTPTGDALRNSVKLAGSAIPAVNSVADSGIVDKVSDPEVLAIVSGLLDGVKSAKADVAAAPRRITALGLIGAIKDPDVNRGIDFALRVLAAVGKQIDK